MEPKFLTFAEVLEIHQDQLARYGGVTGIRDIGLLKSAIAVPAATYGGEYLHTDLFEMGAAYLFHIVQNHPFVDGNKRVGAVAALVFFLLNGASVDSDEDDLEEMVLAVARGKLSKSEVTDFFRRHSQA